MRKMLKKLAGIVGRCESGFTLVELLVVIGIIVVLAGVTVVAVTQFSGSGTTAAKAGEKDTFQTAIETMIADKKLTSVVAKSAPAAAVTSSFDFDPDTTDVVNITSYIRDLPTDYCYTWTTSGVVTQADCP